MNDFLITVLISTCLLFFSSINLLVFPLKTLYKFCIFIILFLLNYFLFQKGKSGSYFVMLIFFLLIFLSSNKMHRFINLCTSLLGYIFLVFLNQLSLIIVEKIEMDGLRNLETINRIWFSTIFFIFIFLFSFFIGKLLRTKFSLQTLHFSKKSAFLIFTSLLLCAFTFIFNIISGESIGYPYTIIRQNAILFGAFFFITTELLYYVIQTMKKERDIQLKIELYAGLQPYMHQLEILYQETRDFRHDYTNILYTMYGYIKERDIESLEIYYTQQILSNYSPFQMPTYELGKLSNIKILELKSLIYIKTIQALAKGIHIYINIPTPIIEITIDSIDLSQILGIFFDNAIESSIISSQKEIEFNFEKHYKNYSISIKNSCNENNISLLQINEQGYSTKGDNRGLGLHNVKKILVKYPNVQHTTLLLNYYFTQKLENL